MMNVEGSNEEILHNSHFIIHTALRRRNAYTLHPFREGHLSVLARQLTSSALRGD